MKESLRIVLDELLSSIDEDYPDVELKLTFCSGMIVKSYKLVYTDEGIYDIESGEDVNLMSET